MYFLQTAEKKRSCKWFFGGCRLSAIFCNRVFEPPFVRNAQKRDKTKPSKTTEGGKKTEEKPPTTFFVMSPGVFFPPRVFEPPLLRNAKKNRDKKTDKK
jgi:hypothetical protein